MQDLIERLEELKATKASCAPWWVAGQKVIDDAIAALKAAPDWHDRPPRPGTYECFARQFGYLKPLGLYEVAESELETWSRGVVECVYGPIPERT